MENMLRPFLFLLILMSSCGSFKAHQDGDVEKVISSIPVAGEGKGRVGIRGKNYVFAFDATLRDNKDWTLSAVIPLHGEEYLLLSQLDKVSAPDGKETFEQRIANMLKQEAPEIGSPEKVIFELRQILRFMLSAKLSVSRECLKEDSHFECRLKDIGSTYVIKEEVGQKVSITNHISDEESMILEGENFKDTSFHRTNFLYVIKGEKIFSLELLWNNT